jgi:hypothetical protein
MSNTRPNEIRKLPIKAKFKNLTDVSHLSEALFLVSIGNPKHEDSNLKAIISLLNLHHQKNPNFKKIDVLIGGKLQRHNFWTFSNKLSDKKLKILLQDIPNDIDLETLAKILAKKFSAAARHAEIEYIKNNIHHYLLDLKNVQARIIDWDKELDTTTDVVTHVSQQEEYAQYYAAVLSNYERNPDFKKAIDETIEVHLRPRKILIANEAKRIVELLPQLEKFFLKPLQLAKICSRNYLFEELPLLIPLFSSRYKILMYPGVISAALLATKKLFASSISYVEIIHTQVEENDAGYSDEISQRRTIEPIIEKVLPYSIALPIFRYKRNAKVDEKELKAVTERFAALFAGFSVEQTTLYEVDCKTYEKSTALSARIHSHVFFDVGLRCLFEQNYSLAALHLRDAMFIDESLDCHSCVEALESLPPGFQLTLEKNLSEAQSHFSYVVVSTSMKIKQRWNSIKNNLSPEEKTIVDKLFTQLNLLPWNQAPLSKSMLESRIMIAKGDELISQKRYIEGLEHYKTAILKASEHSEYGHIAKLKIEKVKQFLNCRPQLHDTPIINNYISFSGSTYILDAMREYELITNFLAAFKTYYELCPEVKLIFDTNKDKFLNELTTKYKFGSKYTFENLLTPAHALAFMARADYEMKWQSRIYTPLANYNHAIMILERYLLIWEHKVSADEIYAIKAQLRDKIKKASEYESKNKDELVNETKITEKFELACIAASANVSPVINSGLKHNPKVTKFFESLKNFEYHHSSDYKLVQQGKSWIALLIDITLKEIEDFEDTSNIVCDFFIPLFNHVNSSLVLASHYYPTLDYYSFNTTPATKIKLLALISTQALKYLSQQLFDIENSDIEFHTKYEYIFEIIREAVRLPLFAQQNSNWPAFFRPAYSCYVSELLKLWDVFTLHHTNGERREQGLANGLSISRAAN